MLETCANQGFGLRCIAAQAAPSVIAVASHGEPQDELLLLWNLCSTLVSFGYAVAVLDATSAESVDNPGLEHLLDDVFRRGDDNTDPLSWSVVPAANGLKKLCCQQGVQDPPFHQLERLFQNYNVVIIYAHADTLGSLPPDSGIEPLLVVSAAPMSIVTAYQALKQLLLNAGLRSTIVSLVSEPVQGSIAGASSASKNLQNCAMTYLGYSVDAMTVRAQPSEVLPSDDMRRLALRLLEKARPLQRGTSAGAWRHPSSGPDNFLGSH